jgi:hypothetical protein
MGPPLGAGARRPTRSSAAAVAALGLVLGLGAGACVGPARTSADYEKKAANSAEDALSAVQTGRLGARVGTDGRALSPYLSVLLAGAEDQASAIQSTFDSIQPPDARSDDLRDELDGLLTQAVSALGELRIAARRGDDRALAEKAEPLRDLARQLADFQERIG